MLKIRYSLTNGMLSGWSDNEAEFDLLEAREGEDVALLDMPKPDASDYEYYAYDGENLISSGKQPPMPAPEPLVFTASPPGMAIGERLNNIEDFLERLYPG